jgi:phosphate transport system substrate-binding protein
MPTARSNAWPRQFVWLILLALAGILFAQNSDPIQLVGVGTTFPLPLYSVWWQNFRTTHPDIEIKYLPFGSNAGIEMQASGSADFGATDVPMTDKQLLRASVLHFPTVLGALVPVYNVPGINTPLRFSPKALAGIYLGTITRWNDPVLSSANPEVPLPGANIVVIHSGSGRGSTYIWSDYLSKVSVEWRQTVGRGASIRWPTGVEAEGNGNLAKMVKETANSIGFVELAYALHNGLAFGAVQNAAGNFITADSSSVSAAAAASAKSMPSDFRASITNPYGARSYPISSFTWIIVPENIDAVKREAVKNFLRWMLLEGQTYAESAGFTPLPTSIVNSELKAVEAIP